MTGVILFYVGVDSEAAQGDDNYTWDTEVYNTSFNWDTVSLRGPTGTFDIAEFDPMVWTLSSGQHTFTFYGRESNTNLDQIILRPVAQTSCGSADSNGNSIVDISELLNYISQWKAGSVVIGDLLTAIGEWKNGC